MKTLRTKLFGMLLLTALIFTNSIYAQTDKQNTRFGIKGGINVSNMYTKEVADKNTIIDLMSVFFLKCL